ncbi:TlpA disulfide reductase family protein [Pseudonocardia sp. GCM10023141]|uniref:TlpA disulfide reductase family protein n=1 Tax=Pseudonocardia sp. GCM10023141 TaxID=3252653 RepID=UPI00361F4644
MRRAVAVAVALLVLLAGCSTSKDAVATGGDFQFVAPGGKTELTFDPPSARGEVRGLSGPSLLHDGQTVGLDSYPGKVVVINIWGSWCGPCRTEAPDLEFVQQQTAPLGAAVLGINVRDDRQAATDFVRDRALTYDSIFDNPGRTLSSLGGLPRNVVPLTIVLDKHHRVAYIDLLQVRVPELIPLIQRLAAE